MKDVPEPCYQLIGAKIRHIRTALGMKQEDLARAVGQTRAAIANVEAGKQRMGLHVVERFAKALGTTPKHLMRGIWI